MVYRYMCVRTYAVRKKYDELDVNMKNANNHRRTSYVGKRQASLRYTLQVT